MILNEQIIAGISNKRYKKNRAKSGNSKFRSWTGKFVFCFFVAVIWKCSSNYNFENGCISLSFFVAAVTWKRSFNYNSDDERKILSFPFYPLLYGSPVLIII